LGGVDRRGYDKGGELKRGSSVRESSRGCLPWLTVAERRMGSGGEKNEEKNVMMRGGEKSH